MSLRYASRVLLRAAQAMRAARHPAPAVPKPVAAAAAAAKPSTASGQAALQAAVAERMKMRRREKSENVMHLTGTRLAAASAVASVEH
ncbi:hypothetical protein GUJ93_ZPchr0004g39824 [Zizania palustris]|uniref:Uncharacterized protein n=1 Tax=Zizania palustris TaxID=103762 RepID=A0A8J5VGH9_ZIZPA|nr:hypothetical protein GUJ93_ZPchr0004g39824 [Zizania palustris]